MASYAERSDRSAVRPSGHLYILRCKVALLLRSYPPQQPKEIKESFQIIIYLRTRVASCFRVSQSGPERPPSTLHRAA